MIVQIVQTRIQIISPGKYLLGFGSQNAQSAQSQKLCCMLSNAEGSVWTLARLVDDDIYITEIKEGCINVDAESTCMYWRK